MTVTAYTSFQRTIAREALDTHDASCCTSAARCEIGTGLERISASTRMAADVHPEHTERELPRGNGDSTGYQRTEKLASDAQMRYINSLLSKLSAAPTGSNAAIGHDCAKAELADRTEQNRPLDMRTASKVVDTLKKLADAMPITPRIVAPTAAPRSTRVTLTEGMYELDGSVYRAKLSEAGRLYAMLLVISEGTGSFVYAPGVINRLRAEHRMTLKRASQLSVQYHFCVRCTKELTKESSIAQGMGDWCAARM